jgi:hypothetical protein
MNAFFRRFAVLAALVVSFGAAQAQNKFLARGGLHISSLAEGLSPELDVPISKVGYFFGFGGEYPLGTSGFRFQPGLNFSQRGYRADYRASADRRVTTTLNYLELPLNVVWTSGGEGNTRLYVMAGGYAALGLGGKSKIVTDTSATNVFDVRFGFDQQRFDYGLTAGAGVQFGFSRLGVFYNHGLADVSRQFSNTRHRIYGVSFTYLFDDIF